MSELDYAAESRDFEDIEDNALRLPPMSLRDWFAGHALVVCASDKMLVALSNEAMTLKCDVQPLIAKTAYQIADAMLKERQK